MYPSGTAGRVSAVDDPQPLPRQRTPWSRTTWLVAGAGILLGIVVGVVLPRGPVTTFQAVALMPIGAAFGAFAGLTLNSRWAMGIAPLAYMIGFELAWASSVGMTVDEPHLGSTWGILAVLAGRGFHALVALLPMLVGAALGAGYRRRQHGAPPRSRWSATLRGARRVVTGLTVAALAWLAFSLVQPASTPAIMASGEAVVPGSVAELVNVRVGGANQWLSIRGRNRTAPVLLYLPGGPGQSDLGLSRALLQGLTDDFVVATVDGRGIGKAYSSFDAGLTVDRSVADVVAATDYLRRRFGKQKIFLFGESGGTITGVLAVQRHPERYLGWIGSGQMVNLLETDRRINRDLMAVLERSGERDDAERLRSFGPPPYDTPLANAFVMGYYDRLAGDYDPPASYTRRGDAADVGFMGLGAPEYTLIDKVNAVRGLMDTFDVTYPRWQAIDFRASVPQLSVPVYLFTGDHELAARRDLALEWFRDLKAPHKHLYSFPDAGHATAFEHVEDLHRVLLETALKEAGAAQAN